MLWQNLSPLLLPVAQSVTVTMIARLVARGEDVKDALNERARVVGDEAVEEMQRIYFDNPGLDTMTVRFLTRIGAQARNLAAFYLQSRIVLRRDVNGRAAENLAALPETGFDSLMALGLAVGRALGYFKGTSVHTLIWWDSEDENRERKQLPSGHYYPGVRRFAPPRSLRDLAADIDDLYWAEAYGQPLKITRVGQGRKRRWLVSLPGTDHPDFESKPNVADLEANLREEMNIPSALRQGVIESIQHAMRLSGLTPEEMVDEHVLICGHSQGGIIGVVLASMSPRDVGFTVDRVMTLGSPTRRFRVRSDVVMAAFEHDQDIIPALDGTPRRVADQRIVFTRKLNRTRRSPLYYAHSSSTYTETVRHVEWQTGVAAWGREGDTIAKLRDYLPDEDEETRVFQFYIWQELSEANPDGAWVDQFIVERATTWEPVLFGNEVGVVDARDLVKDVESPPWAESLTLAMPKLKAQISSSVAEFTNQWGGEE